MNQLTKERENFPKDLYFKVSILIKSGFLGVFGDNKMKGLTIEIIHSGVKGFEAWYDLVLTRELPSKGFFSIPLEGILSVEETNQLKEGKMGNIEYVILPYGEIESGQIKNKKMYCSAFFPFSTPPPKCLLGRGIADKIQLKIAEHLLSTYGNDFIVKHTAPSSTRIAQLQRLGIQEQQEYSLRQYVELIRKKCSE